MREIVVGFDPSLEPLRLMGPAHRGVLKRDGLQGRWDLSQNKNDATQTCSNPKTLIAGGLAPYRHKNGLERKTHYRSLRTRV